MRRSDVSLEDYFRYPAEPECEYLDGRLFQKRWPETSTELHGFIESLLWPQAKRIGARAFTSLTVRVRETAVLIPDVCLLPADFLRQDPVTRQALLCVEILSPEDSFALIARKCKEYFEWGVPVCWVLNPEAKEAWVSDGIGIHPVPHDGKLEAGVISVMFNEVFLPGVE